MDHRRFVYLGIGGVIALVVALTVSGLDQNLTYYLYPTEAISQKAQFPDGERFRLAGTVEPGSLSDDGDTIRFRVSDGGAVVEVALTGSPPSLFQEGVPVLLEGAWDGETFRADAALIRHDENYTVPEEGGAHQEG